MQFTPPLEVLAVHINESSARIETPLGWVALALDGDCCSWSHWDDDAEKSLAALVGARLVELEDVDGSHHEWSADNTSLTRWHALKVTTDKGSDTLMWRNDSNGYYDGVLTMKFLPMGSKS